MKKLIIWLLSVVILAIVIAAGFFYYQSTQSNNLSINKSQNPDIITNQSGGLTFENISGDKLPSTIQLKDTIIEYSIKIRPLSDKAILRITNTEIINNGKKDDYSLKMFEIIDDGKVIFKKEYGVIKEFLHYKTQDEYKYQDQLEVIDYAVFHSSKQDYFAYSIIALPSAPAPDLFNVVAFDNDNNKVSYKELDGYILRSEGDDFENVKIGEHIYQLVDDKYVISSFFDHYFNVTVYYEISNDSAFRANKEFAISREITFDWEKEYQKEKLKEAGSIIIYEKPDITSASSSVPLSENTKIKFIGIRYINHAALVHLIIDNREGWIDEQDVFNKLGISPAG